MDAMDQITAPEPSSDSVPQVSEGPRKSVFDRLEVDDRLKFKHGAGVSFAAAVGSTDSDSSLGFYPLADKGKSRVIIAEGLAKQVMKQHRTTLFGYFLGPRLPFPLVEKYTKAAWSKFGFSDAMMNSNGIYFFKFNDMGGATQVVEAGPLMIRGVPLFVAHWDPSKGLSKPIHTSCPLWVKLHNIPLVAFNKEGIGRIASALGVPKQMDACTASMCDKAWGRPGFAKVLVDVWAVGELKKEVQVVIPSLSGGEDVTVNVQVEYTWEPSQCSHCLIFGHKTATCAKAALLPKQKPVVKDEQGFIKVARKEWKPKVMEAHVMKPNASSNTVVGSTSGKDKEVMETVMVEVENVIESNVAGSAEDKITTSVDQPSPRTSNVKPADSTGVSPDGQPPKLSWVVEPSKQPSKPPIKGILKNTNRFTPLTMGSGSLDGKKIEGNNNAKKEVGSKKPVDVWNIRGLNASEKQWEVRSFVSNYSLHVCAILETHLRKEVLHSTCDRLFKRWSWISNQMYSELGTRIIIAWDNSVVDLMVLESHSQFMHCEIRFLDSHETFFVSFVYAANRGCERRLLWSGLRKFKVLIGNKPWLVAGDFNCLLFPHDALGGQSRRNGDMMEFVACLEDVDLFDLRYAGIHYSWCQSPKDESGLRRKLDRVLANTEFTTLFQETAVRFLPRGLSDHSPGMISFKADFRKRNFGFKFDNFLVHDACFLDLVKDGWAGHVDGNFMFRVLTKLKRLKGPLRRLRSSYGNLSEKANKLKHELDMIQLAMDLDPSNMDLRSDLEHYRLAYQQACWNDTSAAKQRAKVKWLSDGDANTKYFHQVVREKRHSHHIHTVCNSDGVFVYGQDVATAFVDYFKKIIGTRCDSLEPIIPLELFVTTVSNQDALHMIRPITDGEIRDALFHIGNDKAPGSDGFSSKFFKATWEITGPDILLAIHNFFYRGRLVRELNHTLICLLPKSVNATSVSDYRPIACCSVLYKCIAKIIVDRMKFALDGIVSKSQSAFIPGRKISDNILMAHELVVGYHLQRGPPRCAFKIDLRKAYDMVHWEYLFNMLKGFGFHPVLIRWIIEMVSTTSFSLCLNGESVGYFKGERGIRQGDPLSPYLFTIIMEGFSMLFKQCIAEAEDFGFHHGCSELQLTHLCFADDLFVFTYGDAASVGVLKKALDLFALRSGLSPNLQKSDVFFGNVAENERVAIMNCLPFRQGSFPIRYLGVPLSPVTLKASDYGYVVTKVKGRIQNWKSKFLSFGGRKQLITSVLQSFQLYWMSVFLFPSVVIHELEACFRDFLWAQGDSSKGKCKVAWALVCRPMDCGGLGFKRLSVWNRALISRNLWALANNHHSLWVNWILSFALRGVNLWSAKKSTRWSWAFAKMMTIRSEVRKFVFVRIGDGYSTNAWYDHWLTCGPLSEILPYRVFHSESYNTDSTVNQVLVATAGILPGSWLARCSELVNVEVPNLNMHQRDVICWDVNANTDSDFSIKRAYRSLDGMHDIIPWTKKVWFKGHIPKHAFCLWLAALNRLTTQDRIASWKDDPPDMRCSLCGTCMDSCSHLFFECNFSKQVWLIVKKKIHWHGAPNTWENIMLGLSDSTLPPSALLQKLGLEATVYFIWKERNKRLFTNERTPALQVAKEIIEVAQMRAAWKRRKTRLPT
ncbi:hypothetical protein OSB04_un000145 [Centaurea solstitialis]|uniref:Reverse transcriptase domain-containing protein n=1 Tax=Centaurea solstitialis TaxID=347529 RepID=A0AA38VVS5_9ASTR|nr:hypothetical protein OSB04_un000145 [Centaurea solstitialis]